jgi:hypothetical protein
MPNANDRHRKGWLGIRRDHWAHLGVGLGLALTAPALSAQFGPAGTGLMMGLGVGLAALAGLAKEIYDLFVKRKRFSVSDWLYTAAGGALGSVVIGLIAAWSGVLTAGAMIALLVAGLVLSSAIVQQVGL